MLHLFGDCGSTICCQHYGSIALIGTELVPVVMEATFVIALVVVSVVIRMQKLTPVQFFWLVAVLLCIFFVVSVLFYLKYS
jgi:hypothetical protein